MSNSFLSASSIPGGLLPSPSANLFERSIGTLLSTFKYSVADPINTDTSNVRTYQSYPQAAPQYQYSQTAPVNNVNMVMGPAGSIANTTGMIPMANNHKSVKKSTLYGEMMAVKLEKENKTGGNLTVPSSTTYTNINLSSQAPNVPSQNYTNENIKPAVTASSTGNNNTFQIPPPVNPQSQITLHSNYPAPPQPGAAVAQPSVIITPQNNQQIQNVTVQDPVTGTFQNISYQQPSNISIGSNYPQQTVNKVNPSPTSNNSRGIATATGQAIYPPPIQVPSIQQNVNTTGFQAPTQPQQQLPNQQGQRTQYAPMTQLSGSVSNSSSSQQQQVPNQKMEENTNLLSNHLQQNVAPTLNYIVGVFMDSIDSMQQNIDFFQSGTTGYSKNNDGNTQKINYHPNMLTLFNDGLIDSNTNKPYAVNNKEDSKLINEYFNWDLLSETEKASGQKTQVSGNTTEFQQPAPQNQPVSLFNGIVPSQTVNIQQPVQGQPQTIQIPPQITVNGQPAQNIQLQPQIQTQQISIANPGQPQTISVPGQSQTPQIQIQVPTPQLQTQSLPMQQINLQNQQITIASHQTPQLRTQNIQTTGTGTATAQQQQPVVVMVEQGTNYQTTLYPPQNAINQNFVGQAAVAAPQQQTFNTFTQSPPSQAQFNTFNGQQPQQPQQQSAPINYTITQTTQQSNQTIPSAPTNSIQTVDQPQTSQSLMFKGDTQDITRMTRVENTTTTNNNNVQFYQGFENSNNATVQNIQTPSNMQFASDNSNSGQLQDTKLLNKSLDNLNSTSTSVTISNTNVTDTANSNTTVDSVATNTSTPIVKPKRKERPSTKPKPFKCPTCQQTFSRSHDLKRHMYTHTGIKPFKCEKCGKSFSRRDALNRHSKGEINCIRYLNKLNNMKKQQNKAKQQEAKVQQ